MRAIFSLYEFVTIFFRNSLFTVPNLPCCTGTSLLEAGRGCSPVLILGFLVAEPSLVEHRLQDTQAFVAAAHGLSSCASGLQSTGSTVVAHGLSCLVAGGIFPGLGSNSGLPHC